MDIEWEAGWQSAPDGPPNGESQVAAGGVAIRLDALLPLDPATGAVCFDAFRVYLDSAIDLASRGSQPLSLLAFGADDSALLQFLGPEGTGLITRAIVRCLRQETRAHDVVGLADIPAEEAGVVLVACPLITEEQGKAVAERLCAAMRTEADGSGPPWLALSAGIASLSIDTCDPDTLTARVISALRRAQRMGGGIWRHSDVLRSIIDQQEEG